MTKIIYKFDNCFGFLIFDHENQKALKGLINESSFK